jgi:hypothetical protein
MLGFFCPPWRRRGHYNEAYPGSVGTSGKPREPDLGGVEGRVQHSFDSIERPVFVRTFPSTASTPGALHEQVAARERRFIDGRVRRNPHRLPKSRCEPLQRALVSGRRGKETTATNDQEDVEERNGRHERDRAGVCAGSPGASHCRASTSRIPRCGTASPRVSNC